jgi:hypothetical protein
MGLDSLTTVFKISGDYPLVIRQACRLMDGPERSPLWLCRFDRITNHESPFDALRLPVSSLSRCPGQAHHLSLFTFHQSPPSHFSPITASPAALRCASRISSLHSRDCFVLVLVVVLVLEFRPADRTVDRISPCRHMTINTTAVLFIMLFLLVLELLFFPLQDDPWPTIPG